MEKSVEDAQADSWSNSFLTFKIIVWLQSTKNLKVPTNLKWTNYNSSVKTKSFRFQKLVSVMRMDIHSEIDKVFSTSTFFFLQTDLYFEKILFVNMNVSDASTCFWEHIWSTRTDSEFLVRGFRDHYTEISGGLIQQNNVCSHLSWAKRCFWCVL